MRLSVVFALLILVVASLESALGTVSGVDVRPNFTVIFVVFFSHHFPRTRGGVAAFVMGYLRDLLSGGLMGANALLMLLLYIGSRATARKLFAHSWLFIAVSVAAGTFITDAGFFVIARSLPHAVAMPGDFARRSVLNALVTGAFAPPVWWCLARLKYWLALRREEPAT
ncbi:MAG: rod shape-determining protein MreD [Myxococcales bacterium]|nr:rod shape-determining protein MreD [Myxococcales bacterium]